MRKINVDIHYDFAKAVMVVAKDKDEAIRIVEEKLRKGDAAEWCVKEYGLNIYDAEVDRLELYCRNMLAAIENYHRLRKS